MFKIRMIFQSLLRVNMSVFDPHYTAYRHCIQLFMFFLNIVHDGHMLPLSIHYDISYNFTILSQMPEEEAFALFLKIMYVQVM